MWVRSQNLKVLMKCDKFVVDWTDMDEEENLIPFSYCIWGYNNTEKCKLGIYSTEEKALRVLNLIHSNIEFERICYMPLDDEVK